ncbi:MAG TPA: hypothetical protein V6C65_26205 [Allocoleopsis sp.]
MITTYSQTCLTLENIFARKLISMGMAHNTKASVIEDITGHFIMDIQRQLYGKKLDEFSCTYPANWKEAFKERWFPSWLLKKYPVQYTYQRFERKVVFPNWVHQHHELGRPEIMITSYQGSVGLFDLEYLEDLEDMDDQ